MTSKNQDAKSMMQVVALLDSIDGRLTAALNQTTRSVEGDGVDPDKVYTRREAAAALGVSVWTIDRARKDGLLIDVERLGVRYVRITGESLVGFIKKIETASVRVRKL